MKPSLLVRLLSAAVTLTLASALTYAQNQPAEGDGWRANLTPADEAFTNAGRHACFILEPGQQLVLTGKQDGAPAELVITVLDDTREIDGVSTRVVEERETVITRNRRRAWPWTVRRMSRRT